MLTAMLPQLATSPPSQAGVPVDATLQRAWQGRRRAVERLCGEQSRLKRIQILDTRFSRLQQAYQERFGTAWDGQASVGKSRIGLPQASAKGVLSGQGGIDARCVSPTAFAGALGEYQNGILLAEGELGIR